MSFNKTVTFPVPDVRHGQTNAKDNTSTQELTNVPDSLILWIEVETNNIAMVWDGKDMTDRPIPTDMYEVEYDCTVDDSSAIYCAIVHDRLDSGAEVTKRFLVTTDAVGPNDFVTDPSHITEVYSKHNLVLDAYDKETETFKSVTDLPTAWKNPREGKTWDTIKERRNGLLAGSDNMFNEDMPTAMKQEWLDYRKTLRDLPTIYANVEAEFVPTIKEPFTKNDSVEDDETIINVEDRGNHDQDWLKQIEDIKGIS